MNSRKEDRKVEVNTYWYCRLPPKMNDRSGSEIQDAWGMMGTYSFHIRHCNIRLLYLHFSVPSKE